MQAGGRSQHRPGPPGEDFQRWKATPPDSHGPTRFSTEAAGQAGWKITPGAETAWLCLAIFIGMHPARRTRAADSSRRQCGDQANVEPECWTAGRIPGANGEGGAEWHTSKAKVERVGLREGEPRRRGLRRHAGVRFDWTEPEKYSRIGQGRGTSDAGRRSSGTGEASGAGFARPEAGRREGRTGKGSWRTGDLCGSPRERMPGRRKSVQRLGSQE